MRSEDVVGTFDQQTSKITVSGLRDAELLELPFAADSGQYLETSVDSQHACSGHEA